MPDNSAQRPARASKLVMILFVCWVIVLAFAGGASRIDVVGQTVVRIASWGTLLVCIIVLPKSDWRRHATVGWFLIALLVLVAIQLVPLPPSLWQALPGRQLFVELSPILGEEDIWRPISISPGWTLNALGSLVVVLTTFVIATALNTQQQLRVLCLLLGVAFISTIVALLQLSGANFDHPLVNDIPGDVSGFFANRNHFALFLAIACAIVPFWAFSESRKSGWRILVGAGLLVFFLPMILATGSRAGTLLAVIGLLLAAFAVRRSIGGHLERLPKWGKASIVLLAVGVFGGVLSAAFLFGRASSIERAMNIGTTDSIRGEAYTTVFEMVSLYFPIGSGFGTFDPVYRIAEPSEALRPQYLNQAHSDLLQIVLEGGVAALVLLVLALLFWVWKSWQAWSGAGARLARLGSVVILLILLASAIDYPARTPIIMSIATLAAIWLNDPLRRNGIPRPKRDTLSYFTA